MIGAFPNVAYAETGTPRQPCEVAFTATSDVVTDTRKAAKYWNKYTRDLPHPYRIVVEEGPVHLSTSGKLADRKGGPGARTVTTKKLHTAIQALGVAGATPGHPYGGLGGTRMNGFLVNKEAKTPGNMRTNIAIHEMGHFLGVTHDAKPNRMMSPVVNSGDPKLTKRALENLEGAAAYISLNYCTR